MKLPINWYRWMIKIIGFSLVVASWGSSTVPASQSPLDKFILDKEFCAYMASQPGYESDEFLTRYQAAIQTAIAFVRQGRPTITENQAISEIKVQCDEALEKNIHYR